MARFDGRVVVVTGAASGFGEAIARRMGDEGARVVAADIDAEGAERVAADLATEAIAVRADVSVAADVEAMITTAVDRFGRLDVLVNNAGVPHRAMPMVDLPEDDFDVQMAVNVKSVFLGAKYGVPALRAGGGGVIVNTASIGGKRPRPHMTVYNATKGAVITMTRGLAAELAPDIRVNCVAPVSAQTGFVKGAIGLDAYPEEVNRMIEAGIPMGRQAHPSDVAAAVAFLASDDAEFLTGVCLDVDGGRSIQ